MKEYTLAQVKEFIGAVGKLERRKLGDLLFIMRASQFDNDGYKRVEKALSD